jgi:hypothetical protein
MKTVWPGFILLLVLALGACRKEEVRQNGTDILSFQLGQGSISTIRKEQKQVIISMADFVEKSKLIASFQLSPGAKAFSNGQPQKSSTTPNDFRSAVTYTIEAEDGTRADWQIRIESNSAEIGLGKVTTAEKRTRRVYEWFVDQERTGRYSARNGGAACAVMAAYWSDVSYIGSAEAYRKELDSIRFERTKNDPNGTWPPGTSLFTTDLMDFFDSRRVQWKIAELRDKGQTIRECLDKEYILVVCVDMNLLPYNSNIYQYTNRFYQTDGFSAGHFLVIKGYKEVDGTLWFEAYDPYSAGQKYPVNGEVKGKNRYYSAEHLSRAADLWWDYAYVIAQKPFSVSGIPNEVTAPRNLPYQIGF